MTIGSLVFDIAGERSVMNASIDKSSNLMGSLAIVSGIW